MTDKEKILRSISDFLVVNSNPKLFQSELKKVNADSYEEKIINYEQVAETIENSKYANLLAK